jgi:leader peptidase (prepilin peptidase)/N-methyltransferase
MMPLGYESFYLIGSYGALYIICGTIAVIDLRHGIIPDWLNLAIAILGLADVVIVDGAVAALASLATGGLFGALFWLLQRLYFRLRNVAGLGLGDVKFLAAATIWVGVAGVPILIVIAAIAALGVVGSLQLAGHEMKRQTSIPFGPFLALGLIATPALQSWLSLS